nr:hypothetical protein Itr_chr08CG22160 [Ipomoea trifida]GMD27539.1 hypothetical protein Iba_scaffold43029CG0010 [Ipomoea batatas]
MLRYYRNQIIILELKEKKQINSRKLKLHIYMPRSAQTSPDPICRPRRLLHQSRISWSCVSYARYCHWRRPRQRWESNRGTASWRRWLRRRRRPKLDNRRSRIGGWGTKRARAWGNGGNGHAICATRSRSFCGRGGVGCRCRARKCSPRTYPEGTHRRPLRRSFLYI